MIQKTKGLFYEDENIEIFFGNRHFTLSELSSLRPTGVHTVKQTHSDIFHIITREESLHPIPEGDALGTEMGRQYLVIKTADCLPVMVHDPSLGRVAAIHAGWKGVAKEIVPKTLKQYFANVKNLNIYIGPHITKKSFEIKGDVLDQLKNSVPSSLQNRVNVESRADRFYVDLVEILKLQIETVLPKTTVQLINSGVDTKTTEDYQSYRRNPLGKDRNISYIKLK